MRLCNDILNVKVKDEELKKAVRPGAKHQDGTQRPLLVSLPSVDKKRMIMRNAFRLKNNHDHIHISHDMIKKERGVNKEYCKKKETMINHQKTVLKVIDPSWAQHFSEIPLQVTAQGSHTA